MNAKVDVDLRREEVVVEVKAMQGDKEYNVVELRLNLMDVVKSLLSQLTQKFPSWIGIKTNPNSVTM